MLLISTAQLSGFWTDGWSRAGKWRPHWTHDRLHKHKQRHVRTHGVAGRSSSMAGNRKNSWISCPLDIPSALHHHNNIIASSFSVECVNPIVCLSPLMSDKQQLFRLCNQIAPPTTLVSTNWPPDSLECVHYSHHCIPLSHSKGLITIWSRAMEDHIIRSRRSHIVHAHCYCCQEESCDSATND